jgi:DNA mismatch repair ATPase MutS
MSPMFKVYWDVKCKNMNAIIFVQIGGMEFFAFENDAILLHEMYKKKLKHFSSYIMVNFWCK